MTHSADPVATSRASNRHYDPPVGTRKRSQAEQLLDFLLLGLRIVESTVVPGVKVQNNVVCRRNPHKEQGHRRHALGQTTVFGMSGEDVDVLALVEVLSGGVAMAIDFKRMQAG